MGNIYKWRCKRCDYKVSMSGGWDRGFFSITETFHCKKCKKLMDLVIKDERSILFDENASENHNKNSFFSLFKKEKQQKTNSKSKKIELSPRCSYCHDEVELWNTNTKPCPCCGETMIKYELEILWD